MRYTLNDLLSGPCLAFNTFTKTTKGDVDSGIGPHAKITFEKFIIASHKMYLNMAVSNEYSVVDPKDAQLMTLVTKLQKLEEMVCANNKLVRKLRILRGVWP